MQESIFTKIIKGEIPGEIIHQDSDCFVLLTIEPFTSGHMLVIPRQQIDHLWDLDDEIYRHLFAVVKRMQARLKVAYPEYRRIGLLVEGFGVPHAHIHVFGYDEPIEPTIQKHIAWKKSGGTKQITPEHLHEVAERLRRA